MNLTWHIVKKDLCALKWPLLVWLLVITAKLGIGVVLLNAAGDPDPEWFVKMDALSKGLTAFEFISVLLTAAVIQQDLLVGTTAFWVTRPISGARLLQAKLLGLGLVFGLMPVLVTLPWWLGCGYGPSEIAWATAETVTFEAIAVLLGLLWSVVTDGFGRFLMWTLVTLFAIPTLSGTMAYYASRGHSSTSSDVVTTRFAVAIILAVLGIFTVVVHQFLTRRTRQSIAIIGVMAGLIVVVGAAWPWSWNIEPRLRSYLIRRAEGVWPVTAEPAGLKFTMTSAQFAPALPGAKSGTSSTLRTEYRVEGLAESQSLIPYWSERTLQWPDGTIDKGVAWGRSDMSETLPVLGVTLSSAGRPGQYADTIKTGAPVSAPMVEKLHTQPPAYTLAARLRLMRFESATTVPLQAGLRTLQGALGERIAGVEKGGEELRVTFIRHYPSPLADNAGFGPMAPLNEFPKYFLVNRAHEVVDRGRPVDYHLTRVGTVGISWHTMSYRASKKAAGKRPTLEAINALNDAELMKMVFTEQARFTHELKVDPFTVEPTSP